MTWYKDSKPLPASTRFSFDYDFHSGVAVLRIDSAQVHDVGEYLVVAENPAGKDQTSCRVEITLVPNIDQTPYVNPDAFRFLENHPRDLTTDDERDPMIPPKVIVPLSNVKLQEGQPIQLACKVEGFPKPTVTWFKDSKPLNASTRYTSNYDLNSGIAILKIDSAFANDVGNYLAVAENPAGKDQTTCRVEISLVPNIDQTPYVNPDAFRFLEHPGYLSQPYESDVEMKPPRVIIPLTDAKLIEGQAVHLACKIEGSPRPKVMFFFCYLKTKI